MKRLFLVLSLCLGFSAAVALDGTLQIMTEKDILLSEGQETTASLGTYTFDVFKGADELVRELYGICKKPPQKVKNLISRCDEKHIFFAYNLGGGYGWVLDCLYGCGRNSKLEQIGYAEIDDDITLNEIITKNINGRSFGARFAGFIDAARAEAKAKGVNVKVPNKTTTIKLIEREKTYDSFDFNVYDDRRELVKKVLESCAKLRETMLDEIKNGDKNAIFLHPMYEYAQGKLYELSCLSCRFGSDESYIANTDNWASVSLDKKVDEKELERFIEATVYGWGFNQHYMIMMSYAKSKKNAKK